MTARAPARLAVAMALLLLACTAEATATPRPACPTEAPTSTSAQATLQGAGEAIVTVSGAASGEFTIELYGEAAPLATANFVALARCGFYDGIWFHRVLDGFVIQAGDPQTKGRSGDFEGVGTGGPGYDFEIEPPGEGLRYDPYVVAMANNTIANGSQFFVTLTDLDTDLRAVGVYTIFGAVTSGTEVIDAIAAVPVNDPRVGVPLDLVVIDSVEIAEGGSAEASGG
jgi:cyclophilin family peptidyl-prolyl cis-trans isomerase